MAENIEPKFELIPPDMAKIVKDGARNMLELMEMKKAEIDELEQDITTNENSLTNIRNSVRNLEEFINKNLADIENRKSFTKNVNSISTAQNICATLLNFQNDITLLEATLNEFADIANESEQTYNAEIRKYNEIENNLKIELEETTKIHYQNTEINAKENIALKLELDNLNHSVASYEEKLFTSAFDYEEHNNNVKQQITLLNEECQKLDDEILTASKLFDSINQKDIANISTNIINYDKKIGELESTLQNKEDEIKRLVNKKMKLDTELAMLEDSVKKSEIDFITLSNNYKEMNERTLEAQEKFDKEMLSYNEKLTKIEELMRCNSEISSRLFKKIEARNADIDILNSNINMLKVDITDLLETEDGAEKLEEKQNKLRELNLELEKAEESYKIRLIEKQELMQAEKTATENKNAKTAECISILEKELEEIQDKIIQLEKEKKSQDLILQDLKTQNINKRKTIRKPEVLPRKLRRWDSDSTIDGEN